MDPALKNDVEVIRKKIESYMRIVKKTTRDMIPKAMTLYIIEELRSYIKNDLLLKLITISDDDYVSKSLLYCKHKALA